MHELEGGCHCGNVTVRFRAVVAPEDATVRACQCSFCRKHGTRAVSDPAGSLVVRVARADDLSRYRFGHATVDFLVCRTCGVYVAAFMPDPDDARGYATLMTNALDARARFPEATPADYDAEDAEAKRARRRRVWTPATVRVGEPV